MTEEWNLSDNICDFDDDVTIGVKGFAIQDVKEFIRRLKIELGRITFANEDRLYNLIDKLAGTKLVEGKT